MPRQHFARKNDMNWTSTLSLSLLTLFLFLSFIQHGLLFEPEYLLIGSLLYIGASLLLIRGVVPKSLFFYLLIAFVVWSYLAILYAINKQDALNTALRYSLTLPFVILASQLTGKHRLLLTRIMIYLCAGWVIIGLLFQQYRNGRLEGALEYANAWGILLLTALILHIAVSVIDRKKVDLGVGLLLIGGILLSGSRTVLVLMLILIPLQLVLIGKSHWKSLFVQNKMRWITASIALSLSLLAYAVLISRQTGLLQRLTHITPQASEWTSRIGYYRDAWSMIMDSPTLGYGGGAWHILQYQYQTADYTVRYLHNFWLEIWIDSGLPGLLLFSALAACFILNNVIKYRTATGNSKTWRIGCVLAGIALLCHSAVDFTFSYPLLFALWTLLLLFSDSPLETNHPQSKHISNGRVSRIALSASFLLITYFSVRCGMAESLILKSDQISMNQKYTKEAIRLLKQSEQYAVFPSEQHEKIARLLTKEYLDSKQAGNAIVIAEDEINQAIALNPEDPQVLLLKCQIDYARGNRTEALDQLSAIKQKYPFHRGINEEFDKWFTYNK